MTQRESQEGFVHFLRPIPRVIPLKRILIKFSKKDYSKYNSHPIRNFELGVSCIFELHFIVYIDILHSDLFELLLEPSYQPTF